MDSEYWTDFDAGLSIETVSSHSTNSTVSGLPGPGRTLDHFLGILGRKLESMLPKTEHPTGPDLALDRVPTYSTNSTASGLPGLGRTLDHVLGIWGRMFERWLAEKSHKIGLGPNAAMARLESKSARISGDLVPYKQANDIVKDCKKVLEYMHRRGSLLSSVDELMMILFDIVHMLPLLDFKQWLASTRW